MQQHSLPRDAQSDSGTRFSGSKKRYKNFAKWVVIAFVIATPIAYYAMHQWLENFTCDIVTPLAQNRTKLVNFCIGGVAGTGDCVADSELAELESSN